VQRKARPLVGTQAHPFSTQSKDLLEFAFVMLSCFLSVGRMCSSEWFDKKGFSHCGKDLHRTISVLDHTLFSPSSFLNNFKSWQETIMASLPVCKTALRLLWWRVSLMTFWNYLIVKKKSCCLGVDLTIQLLRTPFTIVSYILWTFSPRQDWPFRYFCTIWQTRIDHEMKIWYL